MIWENWLTQNLIRQVAKWVGKIARQLIIDADTKAGSIRDYKSEGICGLLYYGNKKEEIKTAEKFENWSDTACSAPQKEKKTEGI